MTDDEFDSLMNSTGRALGKHRGVAFLLLMARADETSPAVCGVTNLSDKDAKRMAVGWLARAAVEEAERVPPRTMIRLVLPIPPTVNNLYLNPPGPHMRRPVNPIYSAWQWHAYVALNKQSFEPMTAPCRFTLRLPMNMRGDCSNRLKAAEDFCAAHGVTLDDRHNRHVSALKDEGVPEGMCVIEIEALQERAA